MLDLVLMVSVAHRGPALKQRVLMDSTILHAVTTSTALAAWLLVNRSGALIHACLIACVTCSDVVGVLTSLSIMVYVYIDFSGQPIENLGINRFVLPLWILGTLNVILALSNPWTHVYSSVDASNFYHSSSIAWLPNLLFLIQGSLMIPVVLVLKTHNGAWTTARLLLCGVLAVTAALTEMVRPDLFVLYPAVSLILTIMTIGVQGRLEQDLVKARADAAESRVRLLSGQINRHFVFNSLTAIKELVSEDASLAEKTIVYGNRYRNINKIDNGLKKSEELFYSGDYLASLEQAINVISDADPKIHEKVLEVVKEQ